MKSMNSTTTMSILGLIFTVVVILMYYLVLSSQHTKLKIGNKRLTILSTRAASCLPVYAVIMFISLVAPKSFYALEVIISIFEGYSFYCFFALVVENLGGPQAALHTLKTIGKDLCCTCCCPTNRLHFYQRVHWGVFHFIFLRTVLVLISVLFEYAGEKRAYRLLYALFSLLAFIVLVRAILGVVVFYENVMDECNNLYGILKFLVLKVSVGMIVLQGLIVQFYEYAAHNVNVEETQRIYCFVVLCEYLLISAVMYFAFSYEITPSKRNLEDPNAYNPIRMSWCEYLGQVFNYGDVFFTLTLTEDTQPLTKNVGV